MSFFETIILNIILLYFPLLIEQLYKYYKNNFSKYFDLAIITSAYLIVRYGWIQYYIIPLLFLNILLLLSFLKKKTGISIVLATFISLCVMLYLDINLSGLFINIGLLVLYDIYRKNKINDKNFTFIFVITNFISTILYCFISKNYQLDIINVIRIITLFTSYIITTYFTFILIKQNNKIINFKNTIEDLEKEKQLRMSLFQITHEIKNPITVCKGYLDMFDLNKKEHSKKYIPIIKNEINRVLILLEDFLAMTKIKINKDIMDITVLLEENQSNFKTLFKHNKIESYFDYPEEEVYIYGDYNRLNQVMINLIKNSIEACKEGCFIKVKLQYLKDIIKITIEDNGEGMNSEQLEKIMNPFFTTKNSGTGLGLYLSNQIIKAHNGTIKYTSKINKGTKVVITLPNKKRC